MNERIALAATLNANVCTSLSSRYFTTAVPSWRSLYHLGTSAGATAIIAAGAPPSAPAGTSVAGSATVPGSETAATARLLNLALWIAPAQRFKHAAGEGIAVFRINFPRISRLQTAA